MPSDTSEAHVRPAADAVGASPACCGAYDQRKAAVRWAGSGARSASYTDWASSGAMTPPTTPATRMRPSASRSRNARHVHDDVGATGNGCSERFQRRAGRLVRRHSALPGQRDAPRVTVAGDDALRDRREQAGRELPERTEADHDHRVARPLGSQRIMIKVASGMTSFSPVSTILLFAVSMDNRAPEASIVSGDKFT